jgi:hypothetical protein
MLQAGGEILRFELNRLISSVWKKEELLQQWKDSVIIPI